MSFSLFHSLSLLPILPPLLPTFLSLLPALCSSKTLRRSYLNAREGKGWQQKKKVKEGKKEKTGEEERIVFTRWNSTFDRLERKIAIFLVCLILQLSAKRKRERKRKEKNERKCNVNFFFCKPDSNFQRNINYALLS
jgi:hypothetical protein